VIVGRLRRVRSASFRALVSDAENTGVVVARFLAVLELFREGAVAFDQVAAFGDLTIRWTGADEGEVSVDDEFDVAVPQDGPGGDVSDDPVDDGRGEQDDG
jgi:segregation and condensation protein A